MKGGMKRSRRGEDQRSPPRRTVLRVLGIIAAVVVGAIIVLRMILEALFPDMCGTTVHQTVAAPDGKLSAVVFDIDCGATTGFNTQVSIAPVGREFSPDRYPAFLKLDGRHDIAIKWIGERALEVSTPFGTRVYR